MASSPEVPPPGSQSPPEAPPHGSQSRREEPPPGTESPPAPKAPPPVSKSPPAPEVPPPGSQSPQEAPPPGSQSPPEEPPPGSKSPPAPEALPPGLQSPSGVPLPGSYSHSAKKSYTVYVRQLSASPDASQTAASSMPLIIPDDMLYDRETNTLTKVKGKERSKLLPVPEALELLKQLSHKQIAVLAICGPCRSGKSYILSKMTGSPDAFKLGHSMDPETYGIWLGTSYLDFGDYAMLILDTEGIDAVSGKGRDDVSILVMTVLLSSFLIYNSMQVPKRGDVEMMGCFTQLAQSITINQSSSQPDSASCRSCFPNFLWLLRDVSLEVPNGQTPKQYVMDRVFTNNTAVGEAILTLFPSVDCKLLPVPSANPDILRHVEEHESELESRFLSEVARLVDHLRENVKVKHGFSHGQRVDGPTLALLLEQYLEAVNTPGVVPCLENTWNAVVEVRCSTVIDSLVEEYEREMENALHDKLPVEEEATPDKDSASEQPQQKVFLMEVHSKILQSKEEKLLKEMKYVTPAENAHQPDAATQYKKELVKRLHSRIIETRFDETKGQVVTGGVVSRFKRANYEKSRVHCVKCFDEACAPLLKNLRSITGSVATTSTTPEINVPRYTFQQFINDRGNLQIKYNARAIGPAKQKVWEEKAGDLQEWESVVIKLDGYQKEKLQLYQQIAATAEKATQLRRQVDEQTSRSKRLENEMGHLEARLTQEYQENLQRIEHDAAEKLAEERRKLVELKNQKEISENERKAAVKQATKLQKDIDQAIQQQNLQAQAIAKLQAETKATIQQCEYILAHQRNEQAKSEAALSGQIRELQAQNEYTQQQNQGLLAQWERERAQREKDAKESRWQLENLMAQQQKERAQAEQRYEQCLRDQQNFAEESQQQYANLAAQYKQYAEETQQRCEDLMTQHEEEAAETRQQYEALMTQHEEEVAETRQQYEALMIQQMADAQQQTRRALQAQQSKNKEEMQQLRWELAQEQKRRQLCKVS